MIPTPSGLAPAASTTESAALWRRVSPANVAMAAIVAASILVQLFTSAQTALQFDRAGIAAGQVWRLLTGNFVHYSWWHLGANLGVFAILAWIAAGRSTGTAGVVVLSAAAVGAGVYCGADGITTYRGVSGVDCALLAWVLVSMAAQEGGGWAGGYIGVLLLAVAKAAYETITGQVLLPTSAPTGVEVVNITHLIGLALGTLVAVVSRRRSQATIPLTSLSFA